jgi:hypothetical protein
LFQPVSDNYYTQGAQLRISRFTGGGWSWEGGIRQFIYTPRYAGLSDPILLRGDQPFAGWLHGFTGTRHQVGSWSLAGELKAGVIGPAAQAGKVQKAWHRILSGIQSNADPAGPSGLGIYEIANYPSLDLALAVEDEFLRWKSGRWEASPYWTAQAEAGTVHGRIRAGTGFRVGVFNQRIPGWLEYPLTLYGKAQGELAAHAWNRLLQGKLVHGAPNQARLRKFQWSGSIGLESRYRRLGFFIGQTIQQQDRDGLYPGVELWHHSGQVEISFFWERP